MKTNLYGAFDCMFLSCHIPVLKWIYFRPVWLNGWVFVYELSSCVLQSYCSHLNSRYRACFEQGVLWHSGCRYTLKRVCNMMRTHSVLIVLQSSFFFSNKIFSLVAEIESHCKTIRWLCCKVFNRKYNIIIVLSQLGQNFALKLRGSSTGVALTMFTV